MTAVAQQGAWAREARPPVGLERYAVIGDGRSCALLDGAGAIDWLCWPRFDAEPLFAAVLDRERGGIFRVGVRGAAQPEVRYVDASNVVVTSFETGAGALDLVDLMTVDADGAGDRSLAPEHELLRVMSCRRGEVTVDVRFDPRPRFGTRPAKVRIDPACGLVLEDGAAAYALRTSAHVRWSADPRGGLGSTIRMRAGERLALSLVYAREAPLVLRPLDDHGRELVERTVGWWRAWAGRARYRGPHRALVVRSALALKLLCYAPSGAIIAAPTTSLPEKRGGDRNWDYRFCWLRDAAFTARALFGLGYEDEAEAFCDWLLHATRLTRPRLRVLYDVFGEQPPVEREIEHLAGWQGARPVRVGNAAIEQRQLDVHGEVIDAVMQSYRRGRRPEHETAALLRELGEYVCDHWRMPDEGIWEPRSGRAHHVHTRLMEWVALDRLLEGTLDLGPSRERFARTRDAIADELRARGYSEALGTYTSTLDGDRVDATALLLSWYGFEDAASPRMKSTAACVDRVLGLGRGLVRRNLELPDDGAFAACAFWAVDHLARGGGTLEEACARFDALAAQANALGLYAEIIEGGTGAPLGNFPQGFSHLALVNAAMSIEERMRREGLG
jgi:GH15 family glucan-1,4-alpha-glucosidase